MKPFQSLFTAIVLLICSSVNIALAENSKQTTQTLTSGNGLFEVTLESWLKPLQLGRMHAWTASIRAADGVPVTNAKIRISGGMPIHNHGFPTQPVMTKQLEDGKYLLEGFKFNMGGPWVIILDISVGEKTDSIAFDINM